MEGTLFPNRPAFPILTTKPSSTTISQPSSSSSSSSPQQPLKFNRNGTTNGSTLLLPPLQHHFQTPTSKTSLYPLDSLLQNLLHISKPSRPIKAAQKTHFNTVSDIHEADNDEGELDFLSGKCKSVLYSILEQPISNLYSYFESIKLELLKVDFFSLLKGLDVLGNWERAVLLFEWVVVMNSNSDGEILLLDNQVLELMVRILARESQYMVTSKLFDLIPFDSYSLDVRAWTTILHAYSRTGNYDKAIALYEYMKDKGLSPTSVVYFIFWCGCSVSGAQSFPD